MSYRPPTSSNYAAPIPVAGISIGSKPQSTFPGKSVPPTTKSEDWTAFGGRKKNTLPEIPKPVKEVEIDLNSNRNTLLNYVNIITKDLPSVPSSKENKWGQSAVKRKPVTPPPEKTFEEQFPSLGGGVIPKNTSSGNLSKSSSSGSLSMAERMRQKLIEEEEEKKRKQAEEEERNKKEEEERISLTGGVGIYMHVSRNFTMREFENDKEEENYNTLDYDVYGAAVTDSQDYNYDNHEEYEEEDENEEEFQEVRRYT